MSWGYHHGALTPMPAELGRRAERNGRWLWVLRYAILVSVSLHALYGFTNFHGTEGIRPLAVLRSITAGLLVGIGLLVVRRVGASLWPDLGFENSRHGMLRGPAALWLFIIVLGGHSEEVWRALCVLALRHSGTSTRFAVLVTSVIFAFSQLGGRPSRISSRPAEVYFTCVVGLVLAASLLHFHSLLIPITANIAYYSTTLLLLRENQGLD